MDDSPLLAAVQVKGKSEKDKDKDKEKEREKEPEKDGYAQLVEKMEQVRSQMVKMERKYDELYRTFKEKDHGRIGILNSEESPAKEYKSPRESVTEANLFKEISNTSAKVEKVAPPVEEKTSAKSELDIEKLEDNPFL